MDFYRHAKTFFKPFGQRPNVNHEWIMLRPIELGHLCLLILIFIVYSIMVSNINFKVD